MPSFAIPEPPDAMTNRQLNRLFTRDFWEPLIKVFGAPGGRRTRIADPDGLREFIQTRAAHVAQTALYGYLRTRAGTRFPELFSDDSFVKSINIAKWHVWLACVSDLAVYAGGLVRRSGQAPAAAVGSLMREVVDAILALDTPPDAGPKFGEHAERVRARIALCEWAVPDDEEAPFSESPAALVFWAPIAEDLKDLDADIVRNSVRFRWQEVRRELRSGLDAAAVLARRGEPGAAGQER